MARPLSVSASPALYAGMCEAAAHHAEQEICSHLHFYQDGEPLINWFDAFDDPLMVSKTISRDRLEQFCAAAGGVLSDTGDS